MDRLDLLRHYFKHLHGELLKAYEGVTTEQLHWRPSGTTNTMAFVGWHCARTEDNIINFVVQRKSTVWMEQGWDKRLGLDSRAQGTGMSAEDAVNIRFPSPEVALAYFAAAFKATEQYLDGIVDADLDKPTRIRRQPSMQPEEPPLWEIVATNLLTHEYSHLGELWVLRSLQGLTGAAF